MKIKRIINVLLAFTLVLTVTASPSAVATLSTAKAEPEKITLTNEVTAKKIEKETVADGNNSNAKVVTVTANSYKENEEIDENDTYYEPTNSSVTVLEDGSAYINDAVTVFFTDNSTDEDVEEVVASLGGEIVGNVDYMNEYEIKIQKNDINNIQTICDNLMENENVEFASCSVVTNSTPDYVPNDPWDYFSSWNDDANSYEFNYNNWWIKATDVDKAWDFNDSFSKINIGIVDSGFDTEHEDLEGRITFPNSFFESNQSPNSHGTHVAGIIGAIQDNDKGISGIVRDCNLICVDWSADENNSSSWNSEARILSGFVAAVKAGAKVVNFSLGTSGDIGNGTTDRLQIVKDIDGKFASYYVAKMLQRGYDFICCQSAGNGTTLEDDSFYAVDASNNGHFCATTLDNAITTVCGVSPQDIMDRIIIVAAAEKTGADTYVQASYSNGGKQVSICAPGTDVYSTYYSDYSLNYDYDYMSGTSMACPIVTGIASMVWSVNQNFTGAQVKHFVCDKTNTIIDVPDSTEDFHLPTGSIPMVNAKLAVEAAVNASANDGSVVGKIIWSRVSANSKIPFVIKDNTNGDVYRVFTDENGEFNVILPEGSYSAYKSANAKCPIAEFEIEANVENIIEDIYIGSFDIDAASYTDIMLDKMQGFLSAIQVY